MNFTVAWTNAALGELANIWQASSDRTEVTRAAASLDEVLQTDPLSAGESRDADRRILIAPPLAIFYQSRPDDRVVVVIEVWRSRAEGSKDE